MKRIVIATGLLAASLPDGAGGNARYGQAARHAGVRRQRRLCRLLRRRTRKAITRGSTSTIAARLAAGVLGDATKVRYVALTAQNRFTALQSGEIDVLYRNSTQTYLRGVTLGLRQGPVNFYDGQGFVVSATPA